MSGCIDQIYKDLTKGRNAPQGGVGFLSLEDAEVSSDPHTSELALSRAEAVRQKLRYAGALLGRCQVQRHAPRQAVRRDGSAVGW
jgi:hypothetical protein